MHDNWVIDMITVEDLRHDQHFFSLSSQGTGISNRGVCCAPRPINGLGAYAVHTTSQGAATRHDRARAVGQKSRGDDKVRHDRYAAWIDQRSDHGFDRLRESSESLEKASSWIGGRLDAEVGPSPRPK
jgi:hypothetical protein